MPLRVAPWSLLHAPAGREPSAGAKAKPLPSQPLSEPSRKSRLLVGVWPSARARTNAAAIPCMRSLSSLATTSPGWANMGYVVAAVQLFLRPDEQRTGAPTPLFDTPRTPPYNVITHRSRGLIPSASP